MKKCYTIRILEQLDGKDGVLMLFDGVYVRPFQYKDAVHTGIAIGYREREGKPPVPRFFRVYGMTEAYPDKTGDVCVPLLHVSPPDGNGVRFANANPEVRTSPDDNDRCLVHLDFHQADYQGRLLNSRDLKDYHELFEGKNGTTTESGQYRFSCPAVLIASAGQEYKFSFWSPISKKILIASFHFTGDTLEISEVVPRPARLDQFLDKFESKHNPKPMDRYVPYRVPKQERRRSRREFDRRYVEQYMSRKG